MNHPVHCADTVSAAPGAYLASSLGSGVWGVSTCPNNDNVAWLKCASTLGSCTVTGDYLNKGSIAIDQSYWGVQGFQATDPSAPFGACFAATPRFNNVTVHHIAFANNVANTCPLAGYDTTEYAGGTGPSAVDYFVLRGNLSWNGTQSSTFCGSGISLASMANADNAQGPHNYVGQNIISTSD